MGQTLISLVMNLDNLTTCFWSNNILNILEIPTILDVNHA